jgi:KDO2-lipid IV(A) lauroyltransferase
MRCSSASRRTRRPSNNVVTSATHLAQYYALRGVVRALRTMGWRGAAATGEALGRFGFSAVRIRRDVAEQQIAFAFPEFTPTEVRRVARESYANLGRTSIEAALLPHQDRGFVLQLAGELTGWNVVEEALSLGRGMIMVSGHIANWELGGSWLAARGLKVAGVARRMKNRYFDDYITRTRGMLGLHIVHEKDTVRFAPRHLREGGTLGMLADQGAAGLAATFVPFFGKLARTPRGPAVLAIRLQAPLVFGSGHRRPDGRFHFRFERIAVPDTGNLEADVQSTVAAYTNALERAVRITPGQYFWVHRRWHHQPKVTTAASEVAV